MTRMSIQEMSLLQLLRHKRPPISESKLKYVREFHQTYNELRRDEINCLAEQYDCDVIVAHDKVLQLDLDTQESVERYEAAIEILWASCPSVFRWNPRLMRPKEETWQSKSGVGKHVQIHLAKPLSIETRIMLQAILGSDSKREALNLRRVIQGLDENMVLFKPRRKEKGRTAARDIRRKPRPQAKRRRPQLPVPTREDLRIPDETASVDRVAGAVTQPAFLE